MRKEEKGGYFILFHLISVGHACHEINDGKPRIWEILFVCVLMSSRLADNFKETENRLF